MRLLLAATIAVLLAAPVSASAACGVERWSVKTVQDGAHLSAPVRTSIAKLSALPVPSGLSPSAPRLAGESTVYQLTGTRLVAVKQEHDSDYHLILQNPAGQKMIAEVPLPACAPNSSVLARLTSVRAYFDSTFGRGTSQWRSVNRSVLITGVAFFDLPHGQSTDAPNSIELHPVLSLRTYP